MTNSVSLKSVAMHSILVFITGGLWIVVLIVWVLLNQLKRDTSK